MQPGLVEIVQLKAGVLYLVVGENRMPANYGWPTESGEPYMTCRGCESPMREDPAFRRDMRAYGCPQSRFVCPCGQARILGVPRLPEQVVIPPPRQRKYACPDCGKFFTTRYNATQRCKPCGLRREREKDKARRKRDQARRARLASGRPWNDSRAIPITLRPRPVPRPTASRAVGLSKAWV